MILLNSSRSQHTSSISSHQVFILVRCLKCRHASNTYEYFQQILLDLAPGCSTLTQCLEQYFQKEKLDGPNAYKCAACKMAVPATKQFTIERSPNVLTIQLKR